MRQKSWVVPFLWIVQSQPASAHSPVPGIEGFYVGLIHPLSTPPQVLVMVALGVLVGGAAKNRNAVSLALFLIAVLIGLLSGRLLDEMDTVMYAFAAIACACAALWPKSPLLATIALVLVGGFLMGQISIPEPGPRADMIITMTGSFVGANLSLLYLAGGVSFLRDRYQAQWLDIAFRVVAAWAGAIALLMFALSFAADT